MLISTKRNNRRFRRKIAAKFFCHEIIFDFDINDFIVIVEQQQYYYQTKNKNIRIFDLLILRNTFMLLIRIGPETKVIFYSIKQASPKSV